jgi:hypothetical protein
MTNANFIQNLAEKCNLVDDYSRSAIGSALAYQALSGAFRTTVRLLPDVPDVISNDSRSEYEEKLQAAKLAISEQVAPLLFVAELAIESFGSTNTEGMLDRVRENAEQKPDPKTVENEWRLLAAQGQALVPKAVYVRDEMLARTRSAETAIIKGMDAQSVLYSIEPVDGEVPEWMPEQAHSKVLDKLADRVHKIDARLMRASGEFRKRLTADRMLINKAIVDLGGEEVDVHVYRDEEPVAQAAPAATDPATLLMRVLQEMMQAQAVQPTNPVVATTPLTVVPAKPITQLRAASAGRRY